MWRYTRTAALTALGRKAEAQKERQEFLKAAKAIPADSTFGNNPSRNLIEVAGFVLDGEMAAKRGDFNGAIEKLRAAVQKEDALRYDEPPDWIQPVRHTLGSVLIRAKKYAEAEQVYREDLKRWPENGWSLWGLSRALKLQKKTAESDEVFERFRKAWPNADVTLHATCFCQAEA
jgi:tetratricopeptide (TPR) repeat protein